ncbi:MAG: AMP-binding protein [Bacteroidetes bacterium]|nr:AMP-binding protein [Bacteroidota bacterium]
MIISFPSQLLHQLQNGADRVACVVNDEQWTYSRLALNTGGIQKRIHRTGSVVVGVVTQNHPSTYATLLAIWLTGKAYVPVQASYPAERLQSIVADSGLTHVFYAEENDEIAALKANLPDLRYECSAELESDELYNTHPDAGKNAYILFTSGTTGKPKGVPITFGNLQAFLSGFYQLGYSLSDEDRFLQMFELTFDLSVISFLVPLTLGASFYTIPSGMIRTLGLYHVLDHYQITFSLMVPSAVNLLAPYLEDEELPHLRYSQFCGEALRTDLLEKWMRCVPNALVDNVYGPTEATIYCTTQRMSGTQADKLSYNGVAGIGKPMAEVGVLILAENGTEANADEVGELCLSGAQLTPGYLNNAEQNQRAFFIRNDIRYYRTGDLVFCDKHGNIQYVGRADDQIKIQGFRIELAEIELAARRILPQQTHVAVGIQDPQGNWHLVLFVHQLLADPEVIRDELSRLLPEYMLPHSVLHTDDVPLNANGKTDRKALRKLAIELLFQ